jgi:CBS domain containing-hemolysin-like protein
MTWLGAVLLLLAAFVFTGLDAAWQALDRVRLRHRADKGDRRAKQMLAWDAVRPQADLVLGWTAHALGAGALVLLVTSAVAREGVVWWMMPLLFVVGYAVFVQVVARQVFRRLPFVVLSQLWWLATLAGSFWALLARPVAQGLRRIKEDRLPRAPAAEELITLAERTKEISPLEQAMLRSVLDFRRLTAGGGARPVDSFPRVGADQALAAVLADRAVADARYTLVIGADGHPLGAMSAGTAALSGAMTARAQSFARPLLTMPSNLPAWKALIQLRRATTPVAEVRDEETGRLAGILTEESAVARLLGQQV